MLGVARPPWGKGEGENPLFWLKCAGTGYLIFLQTQMLELEFWGTAEEMLGPFTVRKEP